MSQIIPIETLSVNWVFPTGQSFRAVSNRCPEAIKLLDQDLLLKSGDRVGICCTASENLIAIIHAAFRLGVCLVFFNHRLSEKNLRAQINNSALAYCFTELDACSCPTAPLPSLKPSTTLSTLDQTMPDPESIAFIIGSSGSSGEQKWIRLSQRAILHAAEQASIRLALSAQDSWLLCLPLFHIGGLSISIRCALSGATCLLCPQFDQQVIATCIQSGKVSGVSLVPTMLHRLLATHPENWHPRLRCILLGGASPKQSDIQAAKEKGCLPIRSYGLSEFASHIASQTQASADHRNCGALMPGTEVQIANDGRLGIRSPQAFSGYEQHGRLIQAHAANEWFWTDDRAQIKDNELIILGRMDDIIIRGGENISLTQIQERIEESKLCDQVFVLALDDPEWGQVPGLAYTGDLEAHSLATELAQVLESIELPTQIRHYQSLPTLANGKYDRQRILEDLLQAGH